MSWAGLQNFSLLFTDPVFLSSMKVTALLLLVALPAQLILGFGLALAVNSLTGNRLSRLYSTAILVPLMLPAIAASLVWKMLLNTQYGFINNLSQALNLGSHDFLGNPTGAVTSLIVVDIWQWTPFVFLLLLAGLKSLPVEVFEAAEIDGCNGVKKFRYVTFPMMGWIVLLVVLLRGADLMRLFDYSYGLTFGGPGYATETMSFYAYLKGFQDFQLDRGAAASWILFLVVYGGSLLIFSTRRAKEAWS
jgi:multiple sugar transport system permease protein